MANACTPKSSSIWATSDDADALLVPAKARLHGHRQVRRADDARDDLLHLRQVAQQPGPGSAQRHIAHPAAAVDVDEVWVLRAGDLSSFLHGQRGRAVELDRQGSLGFCKAQLAKSAPRPVGILAQQPLGH